MSILVPTSSLSRFANTNIDASAAIQYRLDKFPRVDGVTRGTIPIGGLLDLPAGVFTIGRPLSLYSGICLRGQGARTVLRYTGADAAIIFDGQNNFFPAVEQMQICSDTGGGIRFADSVVDAKGTLIRDLWIATKGQAISLRQKLGDQTIYNPTLERIEFRNLGSGALDARTINGRISQLMLTHEPRAGFIPPACGAMISFEWSAVVESVVAEHNSDTTLVRFADAGMGQGNFAAAGIHLEPNARIDGTIVPVMIVDNSIVHHAATLFYGTETCPIVVRNGGKLSAKIGTDGGLNAVRVDAGSTLVQPEAA